MKIDVQLIAVEGTPPAGIGADGAGTLELAEGTTLTQLLKRLDLPDEGGYAVLVGDTAVGEEARAGRALVEGELVTVFPPIKGG